MRHIHLAADIDILDYMSFGDIGLEGIEHMYFGLEDTVLDLDIGLRRNIDLGLDIGSADCNSSFADRAGSMPAGLEGSECPADNSLVGPGHSQNSHHLFRTLAEAAEVVRMSLRKPEVDRLCWCSWEPGPWFTV